MRYIYSLIRFVPDPARGEFVNVGAIVGSEESSEWQVRQVENPRRARAFDENGSLGAVWSFIDRVGAEVDNFEALTQSLFGPEVDLTEDWLWQLHADHQNIVQLSAPAPMVAESADDALESLFDLMVLDPAVQKHVFTKKNTALAALRRAYDELAITKGTRRRERVTLKTSHHSTLFDFAVTNGKAVQLTHAWSFQVPDQATLAEQVKAWAWTVQDALSAGGRVVTSVEEFDLSTDVDIEVVYVPALTTGSAEAFLDAEYVFRELDVRAVPHDQAGEVAQRAQALLGLST